MYFKLVTNRRPYVRKRLHQNNALPIDLQPALTRRSAQRSQCKRSGHPTPPILWKNPPAFSYSHQHHPTVEMIRSPIPTDCDCGYICHPKAPASHGHLIETSRNPKIAVRRRDRIEFLYRLHSGT